MDLTALDRIFQHLSVPQMSEVLASVQQDPGACVLWMRHFARHVVKSTTYLSQGFERNEVFQEILQEALTHHQWEFLDQLRHAATEGFDEKQKPPVVKDFDNLVLGALVKGNHPLESYDLALGDKPEQDQPFLSQFPPSLVYWQWMSAKFQDPWKRYITESITDHAACALARAALLHPKAFSQALKALPDFSKSKSHRQQAVAILKETLAILLGQEDLDQAWPGIKALCRAKQPLSLMSLESKHLQALAKGLHQFGPDEAIARVFESNPVSKSLSDFCYKGGFTHLTWLQQGGINLEKVQTNMGTPFLHLLTSIDRSISNREKLLAWCCVQAPHLLDCPDENGHLFKDVLVQPYANPSDKQREDNARMEALLLQIYSPSTDAANAPRMRL